jgi:hypothetical protein
MSVKLSEAGDRGGGLAACASLAALWRAWRQSEGVVDGDMGPVCGLELVAMAVKVGQKR